MKSKTRRQAGLFLGAACIAGAVACANIWGFQSVTLEDAGVDSTAEGEGGAGPPLGDAAACPDGGSCPVSCGNTSSDRYNCGACGNVCATRVANAQPSCNQGQCGFVCQSGYSRCDGGCVSLGTADNCGSCGNACSPTSANPLCAPTGAGSYACGSTCPAASPTACSGACVDTTTSVNNCGGCGTSDGGHVCPTDPNGTAVCFHSACTVSCNAGYTTCGGGPCIQLNSSTHCGACGASCSAEAGTPVCAQVDGGFHCTTSCPGGQQLCTGVCVDTQSNVSNCGSCNVTCSTNVANAHPTCSNGGCGTACNSGYVRCGVNCVNESIDPNNCGACGHVCGTSTPYCSNGTCVSGCPTGAMLCSGTCVNVATDPNNCGTCGYMCAATVPNSQPTCVSGMCNYRCNTGYTACNGACVNEQTDTNNCGACGAACSGGLICSSGACTCYAPACPACSLLSLVPCCTSNGTCGCPTALGLGCP